MTMQMMAFGARGGVKRGTETDYEDTARFHALVRVLGLKHEHNETNTVTIYEARRRLIWAVNTWWKYAERCAVVYEYTDYSAAMNGVVKVRKKVSIRELAEDLERFERLIDRATKSRATVIAWM